MTKKQIKATAKYYAAGVVLNALGCGGCTELMTPEQHEYFVDQVEKIALKMLQGIKESEKIMQTGSLDGLAELAIKLNP